QATPRGETQKARRLQKLLAASWSAKSLAVRRVTQENTGKKTAGVDGVQSLTPPQRRRLISAMNLHAPAKPVRRIWIPKPGTLNLDFGVLCSRVVREAQLIFKAIEK